MKSKALLLLLLGIGPAASAAVVVDFTSPGPNNNANNGGFVFSGSSGGVSLTVTVSAVIPTGGGANGGDITRLNGGLGSDVENTGEFMNVIGGVAEELEFTVSNVLGLGAGQSLVVGALLSQNPNSQTANQSGGYGGTFGNVASDNLLFTSDNSSTFLVNQSDAGNLGSVLLAANNGNNGNTGNTYSHSAGNLTFTNSFTVKIGGAANDAVVIQGLDFVVVTVPEPSSTVLLGLATLGLGLRRRR